MKYSDKVLEIFSNELSASMFLPLVKMLAEHMEELCEACMENKMVCTLRPMCPDRRWLSFLIMIGANKHDLPNFCYKTRINEVKAIIEKTSHIHFSDAVLQTDVFLNILSGGRSRLIEPLRNGDFEEFVEGLIAEFRRRAHDATFSIMEKYIFILAEENLIIFYLDRGLVLINPEEKGFSSMNELANLVMAIGKHYNIPVWVEEEFRGFPRLTARIPYRPDLEVKLSEFVEKVTESFEYSNFFRDENNSFILEVEFGPLHSSSLNFKKVLSILRRIKSLYQEAIKGETKKS